MRRLPVTCSFTGLADFQMVSADAPRMDRAQPHISEANWPHSAEPMRNEQRLLVLPPLFSVTEHPCKYGFKPYGRKEPRTAMAWLPSGKQMLAGWGDPVPAAVQLTDAKVKQVCACASGR